MPWHKISVLTEWCVFLPSGSATLEHYKAAMLLSGAGDALGYRNKLWEYNESGPAIHQVSVASTLNETLNDSGCLSPVGSKVGLEVLEGVSRGPKMRSSLPFLLFMNRMKCMRVKVNTESLL